jgi:hypothetical protein
VRSESRIFPIPSALFAARDAYCAAEVDSQ